MLEKLQVKFHLIAKHLIIYNGIRAELEILLLHQATWVCDFAMNCVDYPRQTSFSTFSSLTTGTSIWFTKRYTPIIKPQKTVLIKYLIQGFVMDIKNSKTLLPFLQNECNNISFHPHTQHRRSSHCSEERRRVVFQGCFSKSYSLSPVSGSMEYLMLNTTVRNNPSPSTKQPFITA